MKDSTGSRKTDNRGFTLVELVVSFALLGIFMVAAMRIIGFTINVYYASKGTGNSLVVSNMVADKVDGLIAGMKEGTAVDVNTLEGSGEPDELLQLPLIRTEGTGSVIYFNDSTNCPIKIGVSDGKLAVTYFMKQEADDGSVSYRSVPWYFAESAYMGYEITDFVISQSADYPDNVYLLEFTIHSPRYGDLSAKRTIKCFSMPEDRTP